MRTITAIVITAVFLFFLAGNGGTALTDNSVATVQDLKQSVSEINSPNPTETTVFDIDAATGEILRSHKE